MIELKDVLNPNHRRDKGFYKQITILAIDSGYEKIIARFYKPANSVYCCLRIMSGDNNTSGSASAVSSGYGFDRESSALQEAIDKIGLSTSRDISGRGEQSETDELCWIAFKLGYNKHILHIARG